MAIPMKIHVAHEIPLWYRVTRLYLTPEFVLCCEVGPCAAVFAPECHSIASAARTRVSHFRQSHRDIIGHAWRHGNGEGSDCLLYIACGYFCMVCDNNTLWVTVLPEYHSHMKDPIQSSATVIVIFCNMYILCIMSLTLAGDWNIFLHFYIQRFHVTSVWVTHQDSVRYICVN